MEHRLVSIADQIFEQLEREILSGRFRRGEIVTESALAEELGVSRTPVREAVRRLEQENLLKDSSKGLIVVGISKEDLDDIYEIRALLEGAAARRAARNVTQAQLDAMEEILDMQRYCLAKKTPSGDPAERMKELDSEFHRVLYESTGSDGYVAVLFPLHQKITRFRLASVSRKSRAKNSLAEHEAIYEALAAHDEKKAEHCVLRHLENARDRILELADSELDS